MGIITEQLPKIGKDFEGERLSEIRKVFEGSLMAVDFLHFGLYIRPSYTKFKATVLNNEVDCVSVLIGLMSPNELYHKAKIKEEQRVKTKKFSSIQARIHDERLITYSAVKALLLDIQHVINLGVASGEIGKVKYGAVKLREWQELFNYNRYYDSLLFLNWMKRNSFLIPDELQFGEKEDGTLYWLENEEAPKNIDISISKDEDLKWGGVTITFSNDRELLIQFKDKGVTKNFEQLGFKNKKNGQPINSWHIFLEASKADNIIPYTFETRKRVEKYAQELRAKFRSFFPGIRENPIPLDKNNDAYKFEFNLKNSIQ